MSHSRKLSLSITTRSKGLQQKVSESGRGHLSPKPWLMFTSNDCPGPSQPPNHSDIVAGKMGLPGMLPQVSLHSNQSLHKLVLNLFDQCNLLLLGTKTNRKPWLVPPAGVRWWTACSPKVCSVAHLKPELIPGSSEHQALTVSWRQILPPEMQELWKPKQALQERGSSSP